jgi:enoyl-CoA hydratase/carnithine racemase
VIVHTGNGRAFQTGVDVTEIATDGQGFQRYRDSMENFDVHFTSWHQKVWKPVITAVNGICAGGGFHWVADADIVIAASDAQFFDPHVSIGQVVAIEAIGLIRMMPVEAVMRMALVGRYERMSAQRAYELGLVSQVVPAGEVMGVARGIAAEIAANAPLAVQAAKRMMRMAWNEPFNEHVHHVFLQLLPLMQTEDMKEGIRAFLEKRTPTFRGR